MFGTREIPHGAVVMHPACGVVGDLLGEVSHVRVGHGANCFSAVIDDSAPGGIAGQNGAIGLRIRPNARVVMTTKQG